MLCCIIAPVAASVNVADTNNIWKSCCYVLPFEKRDKMCPDIR